MKKVSALILCVILLFLMASPAAASNTAQCFELTLLSDSTLVFTAKNAPTFWEKPTLASGESSLVTGVLIVRNSTAVEQKIGLNTVALPYDNEDALRYLNHVYITVRDDNGILYEGAYSRINDDRDFTMNTMLAANSQVAYSIELRCDYTYTGTGLSSDDLIEWKFYAVTDADETVDNTPGFSDPALWEVLCACGVAVALLAGVFLYDRFRRNHG